MPEYISPPQPEYLRRRIEAVNDPSLYEGLADFNPLGLAFTSLRPEQRQRFEDAGLDAADFESRGLMGNLFPKWALSDTLKQKRSELRNQVRPALAAREQQFIDQQYIANLQQRERREDAQMQFDFGSKMADKNLQGAKELAEQQGKMNLRQSMFDAASKRIGTPINWLR